MILILMIAGWALMFVLVLYIWADVRETKNMVSVLRRESLRDSVSVRSGESFPNLRENNSDPETEEKRVDDGAAQDIEAGDNETDIKSSEADDEKLLNEVLTEFLG